MIYFSKMFGVLAKLNDPVNHYQIFSWGYFLVVQNSSIHNVVPTGASVY
jgi:hypothetical protein